LIHSLKLETSIVLHGQILFLYSYSTEIHPYRNKEQILPKFCFILEPTMCPRASSS
jgi:hypothetical protein